MKSIKYFSAHLSKGEEVIAIAAFLHFCPVAEIGYKLCPILMICDKGPMLLKIYWPVITSL